MTISADEPHMAHVLIVDDEQVLLDLLRDALRFAGHEVTTAATGFDALRSVDHSHPDLVVLDVNLPDIDGFDVCRRLRSKGNDVPVIFLTARDDPDDLRTGFTRGGDDYLTKPFSLEELNLRIEAILRRRRASAGTPQHYRCGDVVMNDDEHRVWRAETEIELSPTEYRLLRYFLTNRGQALSKGQILDAVWDYDFAGNSAVVETYVSYLRRKIDGDGESMIRTVRGLGYAIRDPDAAP